MLIADAIIVSLGMTWHLYICVTATSLAQGLHPAAAAFPRPQMAAPPAQIPQGGAAQQTHEMTIPNDLIGCIIGRGGAKINEIR